MFASFVVLTGKITADSSKQSTMLNNKIKMQHNANTLDLREEVHYDSDLVLYSVHPLNCLDQDNFNLLSADHRGSTSPPGCPEAKQAKKKI